MCQCAENIRLFCRFCQKKKIQVKINFKLINFSRFDANYYYFFFSLCILQGKNLNYKLMEHHSSSSALITLNIQSVKLDECYFTLKDHYRGKTLEMA